MKTSKLLLDSQPLVIIPELAEAIGLNEAIVLQQLHYWLQASKHEHDGRTWVYNSIPEWNKQFPWWGYDTIKRTLKSLKKAGYIVTGNYNSEKRDRTTWYAIDYSHLAKTTDAIGQNALMQQGKMGGPLPETTSGDASEKLSKVKMGVDAIAYGKATDKQQKQPKAKQPEQPKPDPNSNEVLLAVETFYREKLGIKNGKYLEAVLEVEHDFLTTTYSKADWSIHLAYLQRLTPAELRTHGAWLDFAVAYKKKFGAFLPRPAKYLTNAFPDWFAKLSSKVIGDFFMDCKGSEGEDNKPCSFARLYRFTVETWYPNRDEYCSMQ